MEKYSEFFEILRPLECPNCGSKRPLRGHGVYKRHIYDLLLGFVLIPILRYYCPGCGHTVSFLPSFCIPRKQYSAGIISLCFQLVFACGVSLRQFSRVYSGINRVLAGNWVKQWYFSSRGIISVLRDYFGMKPQPCTVCSGHKSSWITADSLEAFFVSSDFVLGDELVLCNGRCDFSGKEKCLRECTGILKSLQEKFCVLPFSVCFF